MSLHISSFKRVEISVSCTFAARVSNYLVVMSGVFESFAVNCCEIQIWYGCFLASCTISVFTWLGILASCTFAARVSNYLVVISGVFASFAVNCCEIQIWYGCFLADCTLLVLHGWEFWPLAHLQRGFRTTW